MSAEVEVVALSIHHGNGIILDTEMVWLDTGCLLGHGKCDVFFDIHIVLHEVLTAVAADEWPKGSDNAAITLY